MWNRNKTEQASAQFSLLQVLNIATYAWATLGCVWLVFPEHAPTERDNHVLFKVGSEVWKPISFQDCPVHWIEPLHSSIFSFCWKRLLLLFFVALTTEITEKQNKQMKQTKQTKTPKTKYYYLPLFFLFLFFFFSMTLAAVLVGKEVWGSHMTALSSSAERGIWILSGSAETALLLRTSVEKNQPFLSPPHWKQTSEKVKLMSLSVDYFRHAQKGRAHLIATSWKYSNCLKSTGATCHQYMDWVAVRQFLNIFGSGNITGQEFWEKSGHALSSAEQQ